MADKVIMYDSPEAAQPYTCEGWVSAKSHFFKDEAVARYDGCTHKLCACGKPMEKHYTLCSDCRAAKHAEKVAQMELVDWEGQVYSEAEDRYFPTVEDARDYAAENDISVQALDLLVCKEVHPSLDIEQVVENLDSDDEYPQVLVDAVAEFNAKVQGIVLYWEPINKRPKL